MEGADSSTEIWRQLLPYESACIPACLRAAKWKYLIKRLSVVTLTSQNTPILWRNFISINQVNSLSKSGLAH